MNGLCRGSFRSLVAFVGFCGLLTLLCGCGDSETESAAASSGGGAAAAAGVDVSGGTPAAAAAGPGAGSNNMSISPPEDTGSGEDSAAASAGLAAGPPGGMPMGPPGGMSSGGPGAAGMLGGSMPGGMLGGGMPGMPAGAVPGMPGMPGGNAAGGAAAAPARPADVAKWTDKQLREAVVARDRKALDAIDKLVKGKPGDAGVADTLMKLLAAANEKPAPPTQPTGAAPGFGLSGEPSGDASGASSEPGAAGYGSAPGAAGYGSAPGAPGYGSAPGAPGYGSAPGAPGYGNAPGAPGLSAPPGGSSAPQGPGPAGLPGRPGGLGVPSAPPSASPPPQSSVSPAPLDSLSLMVIEYATAWQGPAVGAVPGQLGSPVTGPGLLNAGAAAGQAPGGQSSEAGSAALNSGLGVAPAGAGPGMLPGGLSGPGGLPGMPPGGMPGMGPGGMPGMGPGGMPGAAAAPVATMTDRELVKAIATGLLVNNSAEAWQGLLEIVNGTAKSPLTPEETIEVVVLALCSHQQIDPEQSRQVLLAMITNPDRFSTTAQNASLKALATVAAQVISKQTGLPSASDTLSLAGTGQFAGGGMMGIPGMPGMPGGAGRMPGGAAFGGGLSGAPGMPAMPGAPGLPAMSGGAAGLSGGEPSGEMSGAAGMGFGAAAGASGGTAAVPAERLPEAVLKLSAEFFYTPAFAQAVAARLDQIQDLAGSEALLRLAGSLPLQPVREALFRAFEKHHAAGADALNTAGVFPDGMADPGALVVLKSLPRQRPPRSDEGEAAPMDSWTVAAQQLVLNYVSKLGSMSQGGGRMTANPKGFPIRAHRGAEFEYTGLLKLSPAANAPPGTGISETRIYYARTSFSASKERERKDALDHYRGLGAAIQRADAARGMMWMDGVKAGTTGMRRSVDVLIRSGAAGGGFGAAGGSGEPGGFGGAPGVPGLAGGGGPGGGGQGYTIEVVMVEVADPRGASSGSDAPAAGAN